nr:NTP pyrophosphohydrolase [Streptomyces sp. SID13031]
MVVDAANVVGSRPDGWWRDRPGAARRLLAKLQTLASQLEAPTEIAVVLEGAAKAAVESDADPAFGDLRIVLAKGSGDDAIVDVVTAAVAEDNDRSITVVTADRGLRARVEPLGAQTTGPNWLRDQLPS